MLVEILECFFFIDSFMLSLQWRENMNSTYKSLQKLPLLHKIVYLLTRIMTNSVGVYLRRYKDKESERKCA